MKLPPNIKGPLFFGVKLCVFSFKPWRMSAREGGGGRGGTKKNYA